MDYSKSGAAKSGKNRPKHAEHNQKGGPKNPFGKEPARSELLDRMKAATAARKVEDAAKAGKA